MKLSKLLLTFLLSFNLSCQQSTQYNFNVVAPVKLVTNTTTAVDPGTVFSALQATWAIIGLFGGPDRSTEEMIKMLKITNEKLDAINSKIDLILAQTTDLDSRLAVRLYSNDLKAAIAALPDFLAYRKNAKSHRAFLASYKEAMSEYMNKLRDGRNLLQSDDPMTVSLLASGCITNHYYQQLLGVPQEDIVHDAKQYGQYFLALVQENGLLDTRVSKLRAEREALWRQPYGVEQKDRIPCEDRHGERGGAFASILPLPVIRTSASKPDCYHCDVTPITGVSEAQLEPGNQTFSGTANILNSKRLLAEKDVPWAYASSKNVGKKQRKDGNCDAINLGAFLRQRETSYKQRSDELLTHIYINRIAYQSAIDALAFCIHVTAEKS